ncbi:hypothetical protein EJ02DRAFT_449069 [Clathrospora elynae]|uniref:NAD(P)-binding protein n=1 Tax=Clathrospora elynae TaxID=706981 RepID=A0A6A5S2Z2_9PLEO|nr:hypothetical protein EJ02DRAFT_449069 [Clathrospora elynae]
MTCPPVALTQRYKVALASRSVNKDDVGSNQFNFQIDLSNPSSIAELFTKVKEALGIPSVVVYNTSASTHNDPKNIFSLSLAQFANDMDINTKSAFAAAPLMSLGAGKSATAHIIQAATVAYAEKGYKFYYADERKADGAPIYAELSGEAHAQHFVELIEGQEQGLWNQTFVAGKRYKRF